MQRAPNPMRAIDAIAIDTDRAMVGERVPYNGDIVPRRIDETSRDVEIGGGAFVDGVVFGRRVSILDGFALDPENMTRVQGVYGVESVAIGRYCIIALHVQSNGSLAVGSQCQIFGDLLGLRGVVVGDDTAIAGNVIARGYISIGRRVRIGGCVISLEGSVTVNDDSEMFDVIARQDVQLGNRVKVIDPLVLSISGQVSHQGSLTVGGMQLEAAAPCGSFNTNAQRFRSMDYETVTRRLVASFSEFDEWRNPDASLH